MKQAQTALTKVMISCFMLSSGFFFGQQDASLTRQIDSLKKTIATAKHDSLKIKIYVAWDNLIYISNPQQDLEINLKIKTLCTKNLSQKLPKAEKKFFIREQGYAFNNIGLNYRDRSEYVLAVDYFDSAAAQFRLINETAGLAACFNNMGNIYQEQGNYGLAIESFTKSMRIQERLKNTAGVAVALNNIGLVCLSIKDYPKALMYFNKSLALKQKAKDERGIALSYNNIGLIYAEQGDYVKSLEAHYKSLHLREKIEDLNGQAMSLNNIGYIHKAQKKYSESIRDYEKSLEMRKKAQNQLGQAISLNNLGSLYEETGDLEKAKNYGLQSLALSKKIEALDEIRLAAELLKRVYKKQKNFAKALEMYELFNEIDDSIAGIDKEKEIFQKEMQYEFDKKQSADSIKNSQEKLILDSQIKAKEEQVKRISFQRYAMIFGISILLFFVFFIFKRFKLEKEQKNIIGEQKLLVEEKNKEILDSITYAKRIQSAILPQSKLVKQHFPDSFILYKPKDIVAGDFYWFEALGDFILFAAADCTGHGVPGAMVSVVCHNALNRAVREFNLTDPGLILDKTREIVVAEFEKSDEDVKDGMDISLCVLDKEKRKLWWAGAHNPLWILRAGEIIEFKADKQPIGKFADSKSFFTHEIILLPGDELYIFTDGFQDQFGGEKGKKFKAAQMRELFLKLQSIPIEQKQNELNLVFENWKGSLEQVDDVCVIHIRF